MPRATKSRSRSTASTGVVAEARLARVWFWEGSFARFGINLKRHFGEDVVQLTDLDLLAYSVGPGLRSTMTIGECKSGRDAKPLDRLVWLRGLADVTSADAAELTTAVPPAPKVRRLAEGLGVTAQSMADLEVRESRLAIGQVGNSGSHGTDMPELMDAFRVGAGADPEIERAYWYFRSDAWLCDPYAAVRGSISAVHLLSTKWAGGVEDPCQAALRFVLTEAVLQFIFGVTGLAREAIRMNDRDFAAVLIEKFTYGEIAAQSAIKTASAVDKYVAGLLQAHGVAADKIVAAMGAFEPSAPPYVESLIEVVRRTVNEELAARNALRFADFYLYEKVVRRRRPSENLIAHLDMGDTQTVLRLCRVFMKFLAGHAGLPGEFLDPPDAELPMETSPTQSTRPVQETLDGVDA